MRTNSLKAWFLAARPKTLTGASAPVLIALALTYHDTGGRIVLVPALLCLCFALFMQIDANFINDYFDFKKGVDREDRLGPERACSQGWITPKAMIYGIIACTFVSCAIGLPLIIFGGWQMIMIGLLCVFFCFLYTTTLSRLGLGDILVVFFFGLIPVCVTYYIQTGNITAESVILSLSIGLVTDLLLIVNNYRDREQDKACGKKTLVVTIGGPLTEWLYLVLGLMGLSLAQVVFNVQAEFWKVIFIIPSFFLHWYNYSKLKVLKGRELNKILGTTAANIFLYAVLLSIAIII